MFDELTKTVKAQLYERASSPLLASFSLSWAAWNYRFLIVVASSMNTQDKFQYIDSQLYPTVEAIALRGALYPLLTALLLIFVYPIPAKYVYEYWRTRQRELKAIQQRIDDETPMTREEARAIRREALRVTAEYEQELERRAAEVARLKELVADTERRLTTSTSAQLPAEATSAEQPTPLDDNQVAMLKRVAESPVPLPKNHLIASAGTDRVLSEYNLGELERREFISKSFSSQQRDYLIKPTHPGRTYLIGLLRNDSTSDSSQPA